MQPNAKTTKVDSEEHIEKAKAVLDLETKALKELSDGLSGPAGEAFSQAIQAIHAMKTVPDLAGRLIIAGIGKSGHIARKIAATMASTGTPAYFVHPGEASHGDLGMITGNDIVLMLSNSGENAELSDLIHYTRRYGITLIAITSNPESTLATHADIILQLPKLPEACPNGLAPTTSTTMMIALGDAIAVVLLQQSGLTPEQFKAFHPGGKLGQQLQSVADLMHPFDSLPRVTIDAKMGEAIVELTAKNLGSVIIMDGDKLAGIITDGDLKRHMAPDLLDKSVKDIMSTTPKTISVKALGVEAMNVMTKQPGQYLTSLIVMDGDKLAGMIRLQDCLQAGLA